MRHLASAAGPLRSKASPPESKQESSLGEIPKMGEPQFPLFGRFKGWGVGAGEIETAALSKRAGGTFVA